MRAHVVIDGFVHNADRSLCSLSTSSSIVKVLYVGHGRALRVRSFTPILPFSRPQSSLHHSLFYKYTVAKTFPLHCHYMKVFRPPNLPLYQVNEPRPPDNLPNFRLDLHRFSTLNCFLANFESSLLLPADIVAVFPSSAHTLSPTFHGSPRTSEYCLLRGLTSSFEC